MMLNSYSHSYSYGGFRAEVTVKWQADDAVSKDCRDAASDIADEVIGATHQKMSEIVAAMRGRRCHRKDCLRCWEQDSECP